MDATDAAIQRFIHFWRQLPLEHEPFVHPDDVDLIEPGPQGPTQLQLAVVPIPVNGCLRTADIILLEANPNFDAAQEAAWARREPEGARLLERARLSSLRQEHATGDCPFYDLDPRLATTGGAVYWRSGSKFRDSVDALGLAWGVSASDVYRELSWRVAVLQMFPYRSQRFSHQRIAERCASGREVRLLVQSLAKECSKLIVCQRRVAQWGFEFPSTTQTVITYDPKREALTASLSRNSRGGPVMIQKLASSRPRHL